MKKLFIGIVVAVIAVIVGAIIILTVVDVNRFGKDNAYVQITTTATVDEVKLSTGEILKSYWYTLPAYDENGNKIDVNFSASKELRQDAYLMLYIKNGNEVTSYNEVQLNDVPQKAKKKIDG